MSAVRLSYWFHPEAADELNEAADVYEAKSPGLGARFIDEVDEGIDLLLEQPMLGSPWLEPARRWQLRSFPYTLAYRALDAELEILAVAHQRRRPGYWLGRLTP